VKIVSPLTPTEVIRPEDIAGLVYWIHGVERGNLLEQSENLFTGRCTALFLLGRARRGLIRDPVIGSAIDTRME